MYVLLNDDMDLVMTTREPVYQGDRNNRSIIILVKDRVGEINVPESAVVFHYVVGGEEYELPVSPSDAMYKDRFYQYVVPITSDMTENFGDMVFWLQFSQVSGDMERVSTTGNSSVTVYPLYEADDDDEEPECCHWNHICSFAEFNSRGGSECDSDNEDDQPDTGESERTSET